MKKMILLASILLATSVAQAKTLQISIDNRTNEPMTIVKYDGSITIPANTKIDNQHFKANETVSNFVNNKLACTWKMKTYSKNEYITGIYYSKEASDAPGCILIVGMKH